MRCGESQREWIHRVVDARLASLHTTPWQVVEATACQEQGIWTADVTIVVDRRTIMRANGTGPSAKAAIARAAISALAQADPFGPTIWVAQQDRHIVGHAFERNGAIVSVGGPDLAQGRLLRLLAIAPSGFVRFGTPTAGYLAIRNADRALAVQIEPSAHLWRLMGHWAQRATRPSIGTERTIRTGTRGRSVACTF